MIVEDLIGKPYLRGGRGPDAYDCAGLVVELMRRNGINLEIPESGEESEMDERTVLRFLRAQWNPLERPRRGAVVFVKPAHVGVMLDERRIIHCSSVIGQVCIEKISAIHLRSLLGGFYEYAGVTS